jgi:hypothetical protein
MTAPERTLRERLERLAAHLPTFRELPFSAGRSSGLVETDLSVSTMPCWSYSGEVRAFQQLAYEDGWVRGGLRWVDWMGTEEASASLELLVPGDVGGDVRRQRGLGWTQHLAAPALALPERDGDGDSDQSGEDAEGRDRIPPRHVAKASHR